MLFLFIGYYDAEKMNQSSQQELDAVMERCNVPLEDFFTKTNVLYEWHPGAETKRARLLDGQIQHQDGPDRIKRSRSAVWSSLKRLIWSRPSIWRCSIRRLRLRKLSSTVGGWKYGR